MKTRLTVLSFGAGVQSTALLWMTLRNDARLQAKLGKLPDAAIFADTRQEPKGTYLHVEYMKRRCEAAGFPLYVVSHGDLGEAFLHHKRAASIPVFTASDKSKRQEQARTAASELHARLQNQHDLSASPRASGVEA